MTIRFLKICLFDGKRIHELYEECARKESRIREAEKERNFHRVQIKGYGQDFKDLLQQNKELKGKLQVMCEERDKWVRCYLESEKARKSLGEKLAELREKLDVAEFYMRETIRKDPARTPEVIGAEEKEKRGNTSSAPDVRTGAPSPQGEGVTEGGAEA